MALVLRSRADALVVHQTGHKYSAFWTIIIIIFILLLLPVVIGVPYWFCKMSLLVFPKKSKARVVK